MYLERNFFTEFKLMQAFERALNHIEHRLIGEERNMRGNDSVLEGFQDDVIVVGDAAVVIVIDADHVILTLKAVHADRAYTAGLNAVDQSTGVDQCAACAVDDDNTRLHLLNSLGVDHMVGAVVEEGVQRDDIGLRIQRFERNVLHAHLLHFFGRVRVMCDNAAAKAGQIVNDGLADTAGADDADGQVLHLHACGLHRMRRASSLRCASGT